MDLWLPESARDTRPYRWVCRICDDRFPNMSALEAHVLACDKKHETELHEASEWHREFQAMPDPEWEAYNRMLRQKGIDPMKQFGRRKGDKPLRES